MDSQMVIAGRYRLRERLGQGGMSVVWRADDDVLGREVAVKVLAAELTDDPQLRRQIRSEARTAARLRHANVVAVYDYGEFTDDGRTSSYVVMELVDGRSLNDMLGSGPLPWRQAVLINAQVAAALAAVHAEGVVHRDVKPANVIVSAAGVKLVDFGISAAVGALDDTPGVLLGTPAYLAPERLKGGPVRPSTDVYALGLLLFRTLAGTMPWDTSTVTQMLRAHVYRRPMPLPPVADRPARIDALVSRCLAKDPADRPSSVEVAEVLGELAGLPSAALLRAVSAPTVELARRDPRRPARTLLAAAAAVAVLAGGATWWLADTTAGQPVAASTPGVTSAAAAPRTTSPAATTPVALVRTSPPARTQTKKKAAAVRPGKAAKAPAAKAPAAKAKAPKDKKPLKPPKPHRPGK